MGIDTDNPASFNRYQYSFDNPYKYKDPDGRFVFLAIAVALKVIDISLTVYDTYQSYQTGGLSSLGKTLLMTAGTSVIPGSKIVSRVSSRVVTSMSRNGLALWSSTKKLSAVENAF